MVKVYCVNAFTKNNAGGNPAGVCLDTENLDEKQMQGIAAKVGFSETAFVQKSKVADFKVRFFTPVTEVPLCGHATIATFHTLFNQSLIHQGEYTQETKAGVLGLQVTANEVYMVQKLPIYNGGISREEVVNCLAVSVNDLADLPIEIVSTGYPVLIVPFNSLKSLLQLSPDFEKVQKFQEKHGCFLYAFTLEIKTSTSTAHARMFDPFDGIREESATGTAGGSLACYLYAHNLLKDSSNIIIEQGYSLGKPSEIKASLQITNGQITSVTIGGTASIAKELEIGV